MQGSRFYGFGRKHLLVAQQTLAMKKLGNKKNNYFSKSQHNVASI